MPKDLENTSEMHKLDFSLNGFYDSRGREVASADFLSMRSDGSVSVSAGVGSLHIIVPSGTAAKVIVKGRLTDVSPEGAWTATGKTYTTPPVGTDQQGKLLTITVSMDLGSLKLTSE